MDVLPTRDESRGPVRKLRAHGCIPEDFFERPAEMGSRSCRFSGRGSGRAIFSAWILCVIIKEIVLA